MTTVTTDTTQREAEGLFYDVARLADAAQGHYRTVYTNEAIDIIAAALTATAERAR